MKNPLLRRGSGFRFDVARLQRALNDTGEGLLVDGIFGGGTERAVRAFQRAHGLTVDGRVERRTWKALEHHSEFAQPIGLDTATHLPSFRGDLLWIHAWEGHRGRLYWPGGASGVTLDPGLDDDVQRFQFDQLHRPPREIFSGRFEQL